MRGLSSRAEREAALVAREAAIALREDAVSAREKAAALREAQSTGRPMTRLGGPDGRGGAEAGFHLVEILEATPDLVAVADVEGQLVYLNRGGRSMVGLDDAVDLARYHLRDFYDAAYRRVFATEVLPAAIREGIWRGDTEIVALDGHATAVSQVLLSHKGADGTVAFVSTIARDSAERTRAEREGEHLAKFPSENPYPVLRVARDGTLLYSNAAGLGYWPDWNLRTGATMPAWLREGVAQVLDSGARRSIEWEDGGRTYSFLLAPIVEEGYVNLYVVEITEHKRAEESLRLQSAAVHAADDAVVITDCAGTIEWINPAFTRLSGYTADEALGRNPRDLVKSGKHPEAFFREFWATILSGRTWLGQMVNRRKDGTLYTEDQSVTPILDASGALTHFVAVKRDITERLQLEAQFRQSQKMESVGQLASGVAHDFNNLLTVINGMAELVLERLSADDPLHDDVQEIQHAGELAAQLTQQLLAFSRRQILAPRVLNVGAVIAAMEGLLQRLLVEDIELRVLAAPDVGRIRADPGQIEQVITNLTVNARDAMPQGGRLTIELQNVTFDEGGPDQDGEAVPRGSYVRLAVSDSGVGMDAGTRARIFEPFFTTKGPGKGTGLGMSTVFGIVKQSHGFIQVQSEVGQGTSVTMYLPQVVEAPTTDEPEPTVESRTGTETILVVEDSPGLRKLTRRFLEPAGFTVLDAANGDDALRVLERWEGPVELLLSDVVVPGMSGRHLAEYCADTHPEMKVLYMSGYASDTIARRGVLEAKAAFLGKPFTATMLLEKVRETLDSQA